MIDALRSFCSGWGRVYLAQLAGGRFRFPQPSPGEGPVHFILVVANHFEPLSNGRRHGDGIRALIRWCAGLEGLGVRDADGQPFKHTYFFPAEQYHPDFLEPLAAHCGVGFGEVEVHLHHGIETPDTAENLERVLREFVGHLARHHCLSRDWRTGCTGYSFVHGNWALANSANGRLCGVDNELDILARTGCYLDCTLPSAPDRSQVAVINSIYQCGLPLHEQAPHRLGIPLVVGGGLRLPILLQGPLLLDWNRRLKGLPVPRLENGDIGADFPPSQNRFDRWVSANVHVHGQPTWVFVKVHTHGLLERHARVLLGDPMKSFLADLMCCYGDGGGYRLHFATAREAANMIFAAVDGRRGDPGLFRNYRYVPLRADGPVPTSSAPVALQSKRPG